MSIPAPAKKKGSDIDVLRCLGPACRWMLAYEVGPGNVLTTDLHWMARADGDLRYFPCPNCGGRNIVEAVRDATGAVRHAVTRFATGAMAAVDELALMPRAVRDKLDRVGIKLHLREWALLPLAERRALLARPCDSPADVARYAAELEALVLVYTGKPADRLPARSAS